MTGMRYERTLLAVAFLLGALLRLPGIEAVPLGPSEAAQGWAAALAVRHGVIAPDGVASAFLASAQAGAFALVEPNTFLARLPAALCGLALLAVPLLVRDLLGPARMLALVLVMAVDPTLVRVARDASGAAASVLAAALAVAGIVRWSRAARLDAARAHRWAVATSAALGVLATTGPEAWSLAPPVGLVALTLKPWRIGAPRWRHCVAAFLASSLLAATAGLWAVAWSAAVSMSLTTWLGWLAQPGDVASLLDVVRTAPLAVLLAIIGIARSSHGRAGVLAALLWGLVIASRSPGHPAVLALVLAWCASGALGLAFEEGTREPSWRLALAAGALALAVQLGSAARPLVADAAVPDRADLETLATDLERIAVVKGREASEMPVLLLGEREDPGVRWALRRARAVRHEPYRPTWSGGRRPALVVTGAPPAAPPGGYVGTTYASAAGPVQLWVPVD